MKRMIEKQHITKVLSMFLSITLMVSVLAGCNGNSSKTSTGQGEVSASNTSSISEPDDSFDGPHDLVTITFASGPSMGSWYSIADATVDLWNREIEYVEVHNEETHGNFNNLELLHDGNVQVILVDADYCYQYVNGTGYFEDNDNQFYPEIKVIAGLWFDLAQVVVNKRSGITSLEDILGKRFAVGTEGSVTYSDSQRHLAAVGLTFDDFDAQEVVLSDATGEIDGGWIRGALRLSSVELAYLEGCELLNISSDIVDTLKEDYPWYAACTIPANTYTGQYQDVETSGVKILLVCQDDLDERTVYDLTRTFWMNIAPLAASQNYNNSLNNLTVENAVKDIAGLPLHPGAERYYKEVGVL